MNTTSRQSKFKAKLQAKIHHKSSLPDIQQSQPNNAKNRQNIAHRPTLKNIKEYDKSNITIINNNFRNNQFNPTFNINPNQQNEHVNFISNYLTKKTSIQSQKQLMTADTVRPDNEGQSKLNQIKQNQSGGFDMWNLNKNLKQFSQTRKLPFYKSKNADPNTTNIQNVQQLLNKNKTQQIRSMYKIYGGDPAKMNDPERQKSQGHLRFKKVYDPIRKNKFTQRETKQYSTISNPKALSPLDSTLYGTLPVRKTSIANTTMYKNQMTTLYQPKNKVKSGGSQSRLNPYLTTFINGSHLKRQPSNRNIQILQMNGFNTKQTNNKTNETQQKKTNNFRKNRFEKIQLSPSKKQIQSSNQQDLFQDNYSKSLDYDMKLQIKNLNQQVDEQKQIDTDFHQNLVSSSPGKIQLNTLKNAQQKKKQYEYNRSIQKINKFLLKSADDYLNDFYKQSSMPASKIQFYIDSLNHPQMTCHTVQYKSTYRGQNLGDNQYDFSFKQPKQDTERQKGKKQKSIGKGKKELSKKNIN